MTVQVRCQDEVDFIGMEPIWHWPAIKKDAPPSPPGMHIPPDARFEKDVVAAQALMELFLAEEGQVHKKVFNTTTLLKQFRGKRVPVIHEARACFQKDDETYYLTCSQVCGRFC